jgi:hypothetical protein
MARAASGSLNRAPMSEEKLKKKFVKPVASLTIFSYDRERK